MGSFKKFRERQGDIFMIKATDDWLWKKKRDKTKWWATIEVKDENDKKIGEVKVRVFGVDLAKDRLKVVSAHIEGDKLIIQPKHEFTGYIDQVKLYDQVLKSVEIRGMKSKPPKEKVVFS